MRNAFYLVMGFWCLTAKSLPSAEAFEVGFGMESGLPQGKEADGIRGDFVLRNEKVVALVSQDAHLRRPNMSTFYGADGVTPGCLYDLTLRDGQNDQITSFCPTGQRGQVSWVRVMPGSKEKKAAVETVVTGANHNGLFKRHEYRIRDGEQGIWIITTVRNDGIENMKVSTKDEWTRFNNTGERDGIRWADSIDPADKAGYATGVIPLIGSKSVDDMLELPPKKEVTWSRFLAVGRSPLEAWGVVQSMRGEKTGTLQIKVADSDGQPVSSARVMLEHGNSKIPGYPDANGMMILQMPGGKHRFAITDLGRPACIVEAEVKVDEKSEVAVKLDSATRLDFVITGVNGRAIPCKAQILATGETQPVDLGPAMRAHGCRDQYHSENGHFTVQVPPGNYHIIVTHGIEFSHHEQDVTLEQGNKAEIKASLRRLVDTAGWISADFHNHSTPSGDNVCGTPDRISNIAAENIEFAPTTEHNRIYDWRPVIKQLGLLDEIQTVTGMELTGNAAHLNCFPLTTEPFIQDNGAPVWNADPRISALTLRGWQGESEDRWVQINHPDLTFLFNDRNLDGQADNGFKGIESMVNGMETESGVLGGAGNILADSPWKLSKAKGALATKVEQVRQFIWLQLLNLGYRITPLAVADAHSVFGNGVGGWRMYLPSKTDDPAKIDWSGDLVHHAKAGHVVLTTGPFLQVTTSDGKMPGDDVLAANGRVELHVKVQCTDWQDIDRVQVLVNGRPESSLNFTRGTHPGMFADGVVKFDQTIPVPLKSDAHLIVVVTHESMTLKTGYGSSDQSGLHPLAYHAPIYVDVDGNGFQANHDTLGYEIPVAKMTPDMVREKLGKPVELETKDEEPAPPPAKPKKPRKKKA